MIKCWEKRTEAILPAFFRFRQVSFYIEIFENFYTKCLQVRKIYLSLHSRLRKTSNTAEHGAVVQLVRMRACHARGRGFEPHPHRLKALHESEGLFRIWHLPKKRPASSNGIHQALGIEGLVYPKSYWWMLGSLIGILLAITFFIASRMKPFL